MSYVTLRTRVIKDNTGRYNELPVIHIEQAGRLVALPPLVRYIDERYPVVRSLSWVAKVNQAVGLLLDYLEANQHCFDRPEDLFSTFAQRIYSGTIGEDGFDPSGLYWLPRNSDTANPLLGILSHFSDWMHRHYGTRPLNPWREATAAEERLNWAALIHKNQRSFLGHLGISAVAAEAARMARNTMQRRAPAGDCGGTKAFPEDRIMDLLFKGFINPGREEEPDPVEKYDWRGICITALLNGGGNRESHPFHLWVGDVMADPADPSMALVRIYHPIEGAAPDTPRNPRNNQPFANREGYLQAVHPGYRPRTLETGNRHAGWKNLKLSDDRQKFVQVHWFPTVWGLLFMQAYQMYMRKRFRERINAARHPFLFVSFREHQKGEPYTIDAYEDAHARAVRRIGLVPAKMNGTTTQGHRHAYGQRAAQAKLDAKVIQAGMHHQSLESQGVYTAPGIEDITRALEQASRTLDAGKSLPMAMGLETS